MINTDIKNLKLAKKYAKALFEASQEAGNTDKIYNDLIFTDETVKTNKNLFVGRFSQNRYNIRCIKSIR